MKGSLFLEEITLDGNWHILKISDLYQGKLSFLAIDYLNKNPFASYFYAVTVYRKNDVNLFIGNISNQGNLVLPQGKYLKILPENDEIPSIYNSLLEEDIKLNFILSADPDANPFPVRIERFRISSKHVLIDEILIPII